jgi:hypothetical protein
MAWQKSTDYGLRALAETAVSRVKRLNAGQLRSRTFGAQQKEIAFQISALNRMIRAGKPNTIRVV